MFITVNNISYTYPDCPNIALDELSASFSQGWTGIVGENGAGKSTFLKILCGKLKPQSGSISPDIKGVYCHQSTEAAPDSLEDFALDYSNEAIRIRSILEIQDEWFWRFSTLSHGERKRIQVACALSCSPSILALDEPTNHLDERTRQVLLNALAQYKGVGLLVSHDRSFLDRLVKDCLFLRAGKATLIPGNYSQAKEQLELRQRSAALERKNAKETLSRIQKESNRRKAEASRTASRRSGRHLDKHDSDGRAKLGLAIYSGQDGKTGLLSAQMDKKLLSAKEKLENISIEKSYDGSLDLIAEPAKRKVLIRIEAGSLSLGDSKVLNYPNIFVGNQDHIGLRGNNGVGKSSFLSHLLKAMLPDEKIVYIPQEMNSMESRAVLEEVKELPRSELGQVLSIVARLNSPPDRILSGDTLSPGELRKLMLAIGLLKNPYLIVMDEPTNHLDINSIEALQKVLSSCQCALILVSHDNHFLRSLTDIIWEFNPECRDDEEPEMTPEEEQIQLKVILS